MLSDPPRCLRLRRSQGTLLRRDKFHVHVRYFTKLLKTLDFNSDVSKRPYSYYRYRPGTSAEGNVSCLSCANDITSS